MVYLPTFGCIKNIFMATDGKMQVNLPDMDPSWDMMATSCGHAF